MQDAPDARTAPTRSDRAAELFAVVLGVLLAIAALRVYWPKAAPDYSAEIIPALENFRLNGVTGWIELLPGYPGAAMLEFPVLALGELLGASDATSWRMLSVLAIGAVVTAVIAALPLIRAGGASRIAAMTAVALSVGAPTAYWALRIGHPEEVLSAGLLLGGAVAAARERPVLAGVLLGLACGKGWAVAVAIPVLGLLLPDLRRVATGLIAAALAAAVLFVPPLLVHQGSVEVMASTGEASIFNVGQIFWWLGDPITLAEVQQQPVPQPRRGVEWVGLISHPLIIAVGVCLGLVWCIAAYQRLTAGGAAAPQPRSPRASAELLSSALLVMAGILCARCYLDTWNVPYYILPAMICGAAGEAMRGRVPVLTLVATAMLWRWAQPGTAMIRTEPDVYTAIYLAWIVPLSVGYTWLGLRMMRRQPAAVPVTA